jgi:Tol biopolymer transport system component/DNA-binding winged helix-turn-helix (wHTH) protein
MNFDKPFILGHCHVFPNEFTVQVTSEPKQSLQPKFIEVLCYLAKNYPRIIPREELIENVWGENSYVGEKSLTNAIWHLRQKLSGANGDNEVIETIRKAGYRLVIEPQWQQTTVTPQNTHLNTKQQDTRTYMIAFGVLCLIVIATLGSFLKSPPPIPPVISQITKQPGSELFPAPSPDGRYIVYKKVSPDSPDNLFMQDQLHPDSPPKQLTFDQATEGHSVWSNDSQYVYFARKNRTLKTCQYIQLNVVTHQEKTITDCHSTGGYYYLDISPDDQILAFHSLESPADKSGIYFINLKEKNAKPYRFSCSNNCGYADRDMAFSPDGKSIAVTRRFNRFNENIFLVDLSSKAAEQLTFEEEDIVGLTWQANSEKIIFATQQADERNGFILDVSNKHIQPLNIAGFSYPSFAKINAQLFYQQRKENYYIASFQLNDTIASSPFPVIQSDFNHHYPDYNPHSNKFVYVSNESGHYELWLANTDGSQRQQLTYLQQNIRYPKWSHDGKKIAFLAPTQGKTNDSIYIYELKNQKLSLLKSLFNQHHRPTWGFDDQSIISAIYDHEFTDLYRININSGKAVRLTFDNARYGIMTSPTTLLYTKRESGLWQKEINQNNPPLKVINGDEFKTLYAWHYQKSGVYFHKALSDHHQIIFFDFAQRGLQPLVRLPLFSFDPFDAFTFINNQEKLLFTGSQFPQANIKMLTSNQLFN